MMSLAARVVFAVAAVLCLDHVCCDTSTLGPEQATGPRVDDGTCGAKAPLQEHTGSSSLRPTIEKGHLALLLLLGFGGFSLLIAVLYRALRTYVFKDVHNLDTVFDAGGQVSLSLTAVTVTSQLLWPSDFLWISTLNSRSGLGGSLWMTIGVVVDILLFPALSLYLKTRAPGAKTCPQLAYARFGKVAHITFCILALITNLIVCTSVMLAGKSLIEAFSKDSNNEFIFLVVAILFGSYCLIGGLGTTFYISYFNTALTFLSVTVYILYTSFFPSEDIADISTIERVYEKIICLKGPDGNYDNSFFTFRSWTGLIYGIVVLFMATSISFCDQANWQSRIAAKPAQGVIGFFFAAYMCLRPTIEKGHLALLLLLGFGGFSLLIAVLYRALRTYVFKDVHNLDTVFDAGGQVSLSLTAVTVTSQLLWPSDFLWISTLNSRSGLGGSLWMTIGVVVDILLFPALSLYLKTRAPGAKTFPQLAYARFGKVAHITFCILALITNLIVCTSVMLAGKSLIEAFSKDSNNEFIFLVVAILFGSYCLIGGLGTTFYISYFNTALTFLSVTVYILYTSFFPSEDIADISTIERVYEKIICLKGPDGNYDNSFFTFRSWTGLIYGIVVLFMATSISFCDQANWQSRIAAKPAQGVIGFFFAAYMWFVIPMSLSFTTTLSYLSLSAQNGTHALSEVEIDSGYINPFIMNHLLGDTGCYLLLTMLIMALMSTGSGEVMAISSIIVYDIYKTHINPFRQGISPTACILCGKEKPIDGSEYQQKDICDCPTSVGCSACEDDIQNQSKEKHFAVHYSCQHHGKLRHYEDGLMRYKSWCIVWVVAGIVPYGLVIAESGMNVTWATVAIPVITCPFIWPLFLTLAWSKATGIGMITGGTSGLIVSIAGMLITGSTYEGGLGNFFVNTAKEYSLLYAMVGGFTVSGFFCFVVSMCTHKIKTEEDVAKEWAKTFNIDNPLHPFRLIYEDELEEIGAGPVITSATMDRVFLRAKRIAYYGAGFSLVLFVIVVPAIALSYTVLTLEQLKTWLRTLQFWCFSGTVLVVLVPPVEEGLQVWRKYRQNVGNMSNKSGEENDKITHELENNLKL